MLSVCLLVAPNWTPRLKGRNNAIQFNSAAYNTDSSVTNSITNKEKLDASYTDEDFNFGNNELIESEFLNNDDLVFSMFDDKIYNSEFNQASNENEEIYYDPYGKFYTNCLVIIGEKLYFFINFLISKFYILKLSWNLNITGYLRAFLYKSV